MLSYLVGVINSINVKINEIIYIAIYERFILSIYRINIVIIRNDIEPSSDFPLQIFVFPNLTPITAATPSDRAAMSIEAITICLLKNMLIIKKLIIMKDALKKLLDSYGRIN